MDMLIRNKKYRNRVSRVEIHSDGKCTRYWFHENTKDALADTYAVHTFDSLNQLYQEWEPMLRQYHELEVGDVISPEGAPGLKYTIALAGGVGDKRVYVYTDGGDTASTVFYASAFGLKRDKFIIHGNESERTVDDVLAGLSEEDKRIIQKSLNK